MNTVIRSYDDLQLISSLGLGRFGRELVSANGVEEEREQAVALGVFLQHALCVQAGLRLKIDFTFDIKATLVLSDFRSGDTDFRSVGTA